MVDIINIGPGIYQLDQMFDDFDNIFFGQNSHLRFDIQIQFFIDPVTTYFSEVITFIREEKLVDNIAGCSFIRRFRITQLPVDMKHCFFFRVTRVFLQGVVNNGKILLILILFV